MRVVFNSSRVSNESSLKSPKMNGWSFRSFLLSGADTLANLGRKRLKRLQTPKTDRKYVWFAGGARPEMAFSEFLATSYFKGRML